jgi:hypothetical protein
MASAIDVKSGGDSESQVFLSAEKLETTVSVDDGVKVLRHNSVNGCSKPSEDGKSSVSHKHAEQIELVSGHANVNDHASKCDEVLDLSCSCSQPSTRYGHVVMTIMLLSNMLTYMDRFTIAGLDKSIFCMSILRTFQ